MRTFEENKKLYAEIILTYGLNLQKGQKLIIRTPIQAYDFVKILTEKAYEMGAKEVMYRRKTEELDCIRYNKAPEDSFDEYPQWVADGYTKEIKEGVATLSLYMSDTALFKNVNANHFERLIKAENRAYNEYKDAIMSNETNWVVVSIPIEGWANTLYGNENTEENMSKLWNQIFSLVRLDKEDPYKERDLHLKTLKEHAAYLNDKNFKKLHYKGKITDLIVELPEGHIWMGAEEVSKRGVPFHPNLPTEEVFTMPHKYGVNGVVASALPLQYNGSLIKNFILTFKDGEVVDYSAEEGYETLKSILESDENSKRLGEAAVVPITSPIYQSGLIFSNTLFDENASCHLALGAAYPTTLQGADNMNSVEKDKAGMNVSSIHVDFMVGDESLCITGETHDGEMIEFFKNGYWNI